MKNQCKEEEFWNEFIKNYQKLIYSIIYKTFRYFNSIPTIQDNEDIYNNFFIKIMNKDCKILLNYNSKKSSFTTYISVITRNVCIDYLNNNTKNKVKNELFQEDLFYNENYNEFEIPLNILT